MKREKLINLFAIIGITLACVFTFLLAYCTDIFSIEESTQSTKYATSVFDKDSIMTVNIIMSDEDWDDMIENAASEEYYSCDVEVNGTLYKNVGIRPKGNTSLSQIVSDDTTDRFSFKLEFDHYDKSQTLDGLDKLCLNNVMSDSTYMKEYLSYDIMSYMGVNSSLYEYASISHNGENWGLYLAIEAVEDSFVERNYDTTDVKLYKPENSMGGGKDDADGADGNMQMPDKDDMEEMGDQTNGQSDANADSTTDSASDGKADSNTATDADKSADTTDTTNGDKSAAAGQTTDGDKSAAAGQTTDGDKSAATNQTTKADSQNDTSTSESNSNEDSGQEKMGNMQGGNGMGGGGGGMGSTLEYTDDDLDSYSVIWNSAIFDVTEEDEERVVTALKNITNQTNVDEYMDVDQMLRYMAASVVVLNDDSYFGTMCHNYYLYECDGKITMLPWDYNLSFGGFAGGDATDLVNRAIDSVVSSGSLSDRPMLAAALSTDENMEQYHEYLTELIDGYFNSGLFEQTVQNIQDMIAPYVKDDPTAFYTYDEFTNGVDTLLDFASLRAESIEEQLDGSIPATSDERTGSGYTLVDASDITISDMGSQGGGGQGGGGQGGGGQGGGGQGGPGGQSGDAQNQSSDTTESTEPSQTAAAQSTESSSQTADAKSSGDQNQPPQMQSGDQENSESQQGQPPQMQQSDEQTASSDSSNTNTQKGGQMPGGNQGFDIKNVNASQSESIDTKSYIYLGAIVAVMIAAILIMKKSKRRKYNSK